VSDSSNQTSKPPNLQTSSKPPMKKVPLIIILSNLFASYEGPLRVASAAALLDLDRDHHLPWPMPRKCSAGSAGDRSPAQAITEHQQRATSQKDVILVKTAGGFGNELNTILHGFLRAMVTGKRLVVHESPVMHYFAESPLWSMLDSTKVLRDAEMHGFSVEHATSQNWQNWLPGAPADKGLWESLWVNHTHMVSALISCAAHALFQPNRSVAAAIAPYLGNLAASRNRIVGVHIRTTDKEMAQRQHVFGRRLSLGMSLRSECINTDMLINTIVGCAKHLAQRPGLTYYLASDSSATIQSIRYALERAAPTAVASVITSHGDPYHTGRPIKAPPRDGSDPILKVLIDFFVLARVERFFSNCNIFAAFKGTRASLWGWPSDEQNVVDNRNSSRRASKHQTFAGNIWIRRALLDTRSPSLHSCFTMPS